LAESLKKQEFTDVVLTPASGGAFEIIVDGVLLFSKIKEHRFPDTDEVIDLIRNRDEK
jgi:selT/selW/selH-like putative selenoprotein